MPRRNSGMKVTGRLLAQAESLYRAALRLRSVAPHDEEFEIALSRFELAYTDLMASGKEPSASPPMKVPDCWLMDCRLGEFMRILRDEVLAKGGTHAR